MNPGNFIVVQNATMTGEATMYLADETDLEIKRGAIGMRTQGYQDEKKLVKSQFCIVLSDLHPGDRNFSHVFGYVIEGSDVCEAISKRNVSVDKVVVSDLGIVE